MKEVLISRKCKILHGRLFGDDSQQALLSMNFKIVKADVDYYHTQIPEGWTIENITEEMVFIKDKTGKARIIQNYGFIPELNID